MAKVDDVLELWFGAPARDAQELMGKMWRWFASAGDGQSRTTKVCHRYS